MTAPTEVKVPDIGDFGAVPIIEVHVSAGDQVNAEDPLVTLESDKATMDIPAPAGRLGGRGPGQGRRRGQRRAAPSCCSPPATARSAPRRRWSNSKSPHPPRPRRRPAAPAPAGAGRGPSGGLAVDTPAGVHAGPSRAAHRPGAGRGPGRGHRDRAQGPHHQGRPARVPARARPNPPPRAATGAGIPEIPAQDFSTFGPIDTAPLSRIKKVSGPLPAPLLAQRPPRHAQRRSRHHRPGPLPQRTRHRRQERPRPLPGHPARVPGQGLRRRAQKVPRVQLLTVPGEGRPDPQAATTTSASPWTPPAAWSSRSSRTPTARASSNCPGSSCPSPARPATASSGRRTWHGGTFTISSLGGIGGTSFTPIVNAPEVAILGVVRSKHEPRSGTAPSSPPATCCPSPCPTTTASSTVRWPPASPDTCATCSKTTDGCCCDRLRATTSTEQGATR